MNYPRIGIGVIVLDYNKILLGKRKNTHGEGTWAPPGGHLEFGETPEEGAKRELLEETGLHAQGIRRGQWTNDFTGEKHYISLFMHVTSFSGTLTLKEPEKCEKWEWFSLSDLPSPLFLSLTLLLKDYSFDKEYSYLACPYAHPDENVRRMRIEAATEMARTLFQKGIPVFSPLTHNAPLASMGIGNGWEGRWEGFDLGMLGRAQKLYVLTLPGWEQSRGVQAEVDHAKKLSIPIEYLAVSIPVDSEKVLCNESVE
ncbi:MAG: RNA pyrophosphohydrolase [Chlamydiales bacterium]|nr:RNA pyrophosphohydrolase [Chlamydiales bacterium]